MKQKRKIDKYKEQFQLNFYMQKYQVLDRIGQGAYGVVLKCRCNDSVSTKTKTIYDGSEQNIVAMKQFKEADDNEIVKKTTMREVKVLKMLQHPNIVLLKEAFRKKGVVYLIFEFVPYNLLQVLEKSPEGLQLELIRKLIYQIIKGLAYLHSLNIVHRDIKLQNLLIGYHNQLKICDFGFARFLKKTKKEDLTDYVATRWYRPPQLLVGANYGKQIDIWAVGCILGELIDGNPMFPGQNQQDQLFLIQKCLGPLTSEHQQTFLKNPRFLGTKFPQINNLQTVQKRYLGKLPPKGLNFLKQLLKMNPSERLTAVEALQHPYFDGMREQQLVRKYSSNNYVKNQHKDELIISGASTSIPDRKKYGTNLYNPPIHTHGQRQKTQSSQGQINFTNKNPKIHINKKPVPKKQENYTSSKGFNNPSVKSKSVAKGKVSKMGKQKNVSLQKYNHRETITKTQTGFYMVSGGVIQEKQEEQDSVHYNNYPQYRNKIYNVRSPKSKKQNKRNNISTEEIQEQDPEGVWQSTGQLPFLMMASHKSTQNKNNKMNTNPPPNIIITNSTFNYRHS